MNERFFSATCLEEYRAGRAQVVQEDAAHAKVDDSSSGGDQVPREGEAEWLNEIGYLGLRAEGLGQRFFAEAHRGESLIIQLAVFDHSRHTGYWASRLGGDS